MLSDRPGRGWRSRASMAAEGGLGDARCVVTKILPNGDAETFTTGVWIQEILDLASD